MEQCGGLLKWLRDVHEYREIKMKIKILLFILLTILISISGCVDKQEGEPTPTDNEPEIYGR